MIGHQTGIRKQLSCHPENSQTGYSMIDIPEVYSQRVRRHDLPWNWLTTGVGLVALHFCLAVVSSHFASNRELAEQPILLATGVQLAAGTLFLLLVAGVRSAPNSGRKVFFWMLAAGALMRGNLIVSAPILEDDFYRYLWDGAVTAHGFSPYAFSPSQILEGDAQDQPVPPEVSRLAGQAEPILGKVNHPHLRTIYPPVAQGAFALAHWLAPWTLSGWRIVLSVADLLTLGLLALLLRRLKLPLHGLVIYWWNPILIKETYNSVHMDIIVLPFVLGAVLLALRHKYMASALILGVAVGTKLWPALLLPVLLRPIFSEAKKWIPAVCLFGLVVAIFFAPLHEAGWSESSGLWKYAQTWEMNDSLFMLLLWLVGAVLKLAGILIGHEQLIARLAVVVLLACWVGWLVRTECRDPMGLCDRCLWIVAALFLVSPTQFPWYYLWLLPFLVVRPRMSLLLLTVTLPIYYLRFYFDAIDEVEVFDQGVVWIAFAPVWLLLVRDWVIRPRHSRHKELAKLAA